MGKYIELEGTKEQIINHLKEQNQNIDGSDRVTKNDIKAFLDIIEQNRDLLSDDELFEKRKPKYSGNPKFITSNAEYYISVKKSTLEIISLIADFTIKIPITHILQLFGIEAKGAYVTKLDSTLGESCIMLEAARKKKKGISKNLFKANHGECVNSYLYCNYNVEGKCMCTPNNVEDICERLEDKKIISKKRKKYFYLDII